jgi:hypothetical protein
LPFEFLAIETGFGMGRALGWLWACGVSIARLTHCTRDKSTLCCSSSSQIHTAAVTV